MKTIETSWTDAQGLKFYARAWEPDNRPKAAVALLHGLGEHIGRFDHVGEAFTDAGYAVMGFDLRGHGRSGGPRGHAPSYEKLMQDIDLLLHHIRERYPGLPLFLYGHSLGGLLSLNYGLRRRPDLIGVIVTAPALHSDLGNQPLKVTMARILGGLLPAVTVPSGLKTSMLSHDPRVERDYLNDPLVHDRISLGLGKMLLETNRWALQHAAEFPLPLLLMQGELDTIAYPSSSREFASPLGRMATLVLWPGMYHEIHNEQGKAEVLKTSIRWMDERLDHK